MMIQFLLIFSPGNSGFCFKFPAMAYIMVDVESDGPIPGDYSMISFGAVLVNDGLDAQK